jgi:hypothetical protein
MQSFDYNKALTANFFGEAGFHSLRRFILGSLLPQILMFF